MSGITHTPFTDEETKARGGGGAQVRVRWGLAPSGSALDPAAPFSSLLHCSAQTPLQCGFSEGPPTLFSDVLEGGTTLHPFLASPMGLSLGAGASRSAQLLRVWPRRSEPQARRPGTGDTPSVDLLAGRWSVCHHRHFWGSLAEAVGAEALRQSGCGGQGLVASSRPCGAPQGDLGPPASLSQSPFLLRFGARVRGIWGWDAAG